MHATGHLKVRLRRLKKEKAARAKLDAVEAQIREQEVAARDLEAQAAAIDAAVFDLNAVNPNATPDVDNRSPPQIIQNIQEQGRIVSDALARLSALLEAAPEEQSAKVRRERSGAATHASLPRPDWGGARWCRRLGEPASTLQWLESCACSALLVPMSVADSSIEKCAM